MGRIPRSRRKARSTRRRLQPRVRATFSTGAVPRAATMRPTAGAALSRSRRRESSRAASHRSSAANRRSFVRAERRPRISAPTEAAPTSVERGSSRSVAAAMARSKNALGAPGRNRIPRVRTRGPARRSHGRVKVPARKRRGCTRQRPPTRRANRSSRWTINSGHPSGTTRSTGRSERGRGSETSHTHSR